MNFRLSGGSAEGLGAIGAGAHGAEVVVAEDSRGVAVVEVDLDGVVSHLCGGLCAGLGLEHRQDGRGRGSAAGECFFLFALIVAGGAGAIVA